MHRLRTWIKRYKWWAISVCLYGIVGFTMRQQGSIDLQWVAFAQGATEPTSTQTLIQNLNVVLKIIYVIMWPLLVIAGMAMDNSLVLGEVFHLDKPLRQFRRIMTNFANFALGFMVIFYILKFVVGSKGDTKEVFDIIKKALIAGIGIQASWFLMLAALDVSNIAIYSIGSIPTNVLEADAQLGNKKVLKVHSTVDYAKFNVEGTEGDSDESFDLYYSCGAEQWRQCTFASGYMFNLTEADYCVLGGMYARDSIMKLSGRDYVPTHNQDVGPAFTPEDVGFNVQSDPNWGESVSWADVQAPDAASADCQTLGDLISGSKGFVGPLVTVYSSILDFASINLTDTQKTTGGVMIVFLLKTLIALALLIPMIMLCGVLIVRVGYLWFYMAFMPIYVIRWAFGLKFSILGNEDRDSISGLVGAIFMPVIVVFALSMSLVFLTLTTEVMSPADTEKSAEFRGNFDIEKIDKDDVTIYKLPPTGNELHFKKPDQFYGASMFRDFFAYIFINLMAIGMMWLLYFAAMKSRKGMSKTVDSRKGQAESLMMKLPVVPVPGGGKVGMGTAFNTNPNDRSGLVGRSLAGVTDKMSRQENAAIGNMMANKDLNTDKEWKSAAAAFTGTPGIGFNQAAQNAIKGQGDTASTSATYLDAESINEIATLGRENDGAKAIATQNIVKDLELQSGVDDAKKRLTMWGDNPEIRGWLRDDVKKSAGGMKFLTIAGGSHVLHILNDKLTLSKVGASMFAGKDKEEIAKIIAAQPIAMANQLMAIVDNPDEVRGAREYKEGTGAETIYTIGGSKYTWDDESKQFVASGAATTTVPDSKLLHDQSAAEIQESLKAYNITGVNEMITDSRKDLNDQKKAAFDAELEKAKLVISNETYERKDDRYVLMDPQPETSGVPPATPTSEPTEEGENNDNKEPEE